MDLTDSTSNTTDDGQLRLPDAKAYLTEPDLRRLLQLSAWAFRNLSEEERPPCIYLRPRKRVYDPDAVAAWLQARGLNEQEG